MVELQEEGQEDVEINGHAKNWRVPLQLKIFGNLSLANLKLEDFRGCEEYCAKVLAIDSSNVRALYRMSKVQTRAGDYKAALRLLKSALEYSPGLKSLVKEVKLVRDLIRVQKEKRSKIAVKMLSGSSSSKPKSTGKSNEDEALPGASEVRTNSNTSCATVLRHSFRTKCRQVTCH